MNEYSQVMNNLIAELEKLPGIGRRSAERISYHLLVSDEKDVLPLAGAIKHLKKSTLHCQTCFHISDSSPCHICQDDRRDPSLLCVVEQPKDLLKIESSGTYNGHYHVLTGCLSPLDGVTEEHLTFKALISRLKKHDFKEVIIATGANLDGEATALYLQDLLQDYPGQITQLARGLPSGSALEFASNSILSDALTGRKILKKSNQGQAATEYILACALLLIALTALLKFLQWEENPFDKDLEEKQAYWQWPIP